MAAHGARSDDDVLHADNQPAPGGMDDEARYRAGNDSVVVTQHETPGHAVYGPEAAEVETVASPPTGDDADPLEHADRAVMTPGRAGSLADQRELIDEDGDDIREYTGEPVETDEGWVIPQAQNRGPVRDDSTPPRTAPAIPGS